MSELTPKHTSDLLLPTTSNIRESPTGNLRNKCVLKPGHSLMDWIRFQNSYVDCSGTRGAIISVTGEELAKNNTRNNAWMAIHGKVYNVTHYMNFHPGGADELMNGVGKDATKLFEKIHSWVNYEKMLSKCFIGPYEKESKVTESNVKSKRLSSEFKFPITVQQTVSNIIPRFDWRQKCSNITLYFLTCGFCNPGLIVEQKHSSRLKIRILIERIMHEYKFDLHNFICWPPTALKIFTETGRIEITFSKSAAELWPIYGSHTSKKVTQFEDYEYDYEVKANEMFNDNSFELSLKAQMDVILLEPVGYHVTISSKINEVSIKRSYTPVPHKFHKNKDLKKFQSLDLKFLIKSYDSGLLSHFLCHINIGRTLKVSQPKGDINLYSLLPHSRFVLLAAGSGLTPMLSLIDHLLQRSSKRVENLLLMYFNNTEGDIWCKEALDALKLQDDRFQIMHVLSQPTSTWKGPTGRISVHFLAPIKDKNRMEFSTFAMMCGSSSFIQATENIFKFINFTHKNIHIF